MIRAATEADAPVLAEIQVRAWRWAYSDFIAEDDMPIAEVRLPAWREVIPSGRVRVFEQDGTVAGFVVVDADELVALYVDPAAQGAGVGSRLLADGVARIAEGGHARAWLYVFAANGHGRAFYERHGWERAGDLLGEGEWRAPGYRYERPL